MATLHVIIHTPSANAEVDDNLSVTGAVTLQGAIFKKLTSVGVRFGETGAQRVATVNGASWRCDGTVARDLPAGQPLTITVDATAAIPSAVASEGDDSVDGEGTVTVILRATPPDVAVEDFVSPVTASTLPYHFTFRGTARDAGSGVASVQFRVDGDAFAGVDNVSGDWAQWAKTIDLPAGSHQLTVEAADTHQARASQVRPIVVRTPFEPTDVEQVFAPTTYLRELLEFAGRQIKVGATSAGPSAQVLAGRFFQPFDTLTLASAYEQAVRPVHQARLAVEVLRRYVGSPAPPEIDRRFRSAAYQAMLRELGTRIMRALPAIPPPPPTRRCCESSARRTTTCAWRGSRTRRRGGRSRRGSASRSRIRGRIASTSSRWHPTTSPTRG